MSAPQTQTPAPAPKPGNGGNGSKPPAAPVATAPAAASVPAAAKADAPKADADADDVDFEEGKTRQSRKVYITSGDVQEFKNIAEAEKFLNSGKAPKDFAVIRGLKVEQKQKVSLR